MAKVLVIGAGVMGLASAWQAVRDGHQVDVVEAASEPGGMAAHFDFDGDSVERFYHFVCRTDYPTFDLLRELGMEDRLRWKPTTMGFYADGRLHPWGNPLALLSLPRTSLISRLRYGLLAFISVRRDSWPELEDRSAKDWIIRWCGEDGYQKFWRSLLDYKFYEYADDISAAWIWTRIRRIGRSRSSLMQEQLGYIEGGSQSLVDALVQSIESHGGRLHYGSPIHSVTTRDNRVTGATTAAHHFPADFVISTTPTPYVADMVPDLPDDWKQKYRAINNIGVICVIFKLHRQVTPHFWVNVSVPDLTIPGVVELSNLRKELDSSIVYVPYYMPTTNEKFSWPDQRLLDEAFGCLQMLNPALRPGDIIATKVARLRYGQPICEPGFASKIPPVQTPIEGLQIADTCFYYPEDRGIAESVRLGRSMAHAISTAVAATAKQQLELAS
ncbi:NAD(P)/FAD-dependent oxidoreductase [Edaphobacter aggregans]|uniref:NAD(P)/FAD-dependent oxidoreductase n=1 Tax=Edaphobacter aggregans TaxID=570835 RepID=UPI0006923EF9|nr:NAD(P)/FAD-dependent oxidoreductase [Edaphobacter aggregans]